MQCFDVNVLILRITGIVYEIACLVHKHADYATEESGAILCTAMFLVKTCRLIPRPRLTDRCSSHKVLKKTSVLYLQHI
jgi:hypothetical protein